MKKSIFKRKRTYAIIIVSLLTIVYLIMHSGISFSPDDDALISDYKLKGIDLNIKEEAYKSISYKYYYTGIDSTKSTILLFVHGTPGAGAMFGKFMSDKDLLEKADIISVDRLGYGNSDFGTSYPILIDQAQQLNHLCSQFPNRKIIAVGHSFGGPIVVKQACAFTEDLSALILLAPALDPETERFEGLAKLAWWKLTSWYFPKLFRVAADEKIAHRKELEIMNDDLKNISIPILHIHGTNDWMVPYENLQFAEKVFKSADLIPVTLEGSSHFLFTGNDFEKVKVEILKFLKRSEFN